MNWRAWKKFLRSFMPQFVWKTGKITSVIAFLWCKFIREKPDNSGNKAKASNCTGEPWHGTKTTKKENRIIFLLVLLTSNHMIFLVRFRMNQYAQFKIALYLWALVILLTLEKVTHAQCFVPSYTQNHVITYINCTLLSSITIINRYIGSRIYT